MTETGECLSGVYEHRPFSSALSKIASAFEHESIDSRAGTVMARTAHASGPHKAQVNYCTDADTAEP